MYFSLCIEWLHYLICPIIRYSTNGYRLGRPHSPGCGEFQQEVRVKCMRRAAAGTVPWKNLCARKRKPILQAINTCTVQWTAKLVSLFAPASALFNPCLLWIPRNKHGQSPTTNIRRSWVDCSAEFSASYKAGPSHALKASFNSVWLDRSSPQPHLLQLVHNLPLILPPILQI